MTVLPDERLIALQPALLATLHEAAREISGDSFATFFDQSMQSVLLDAFCRVGAEEGTVWLLDEKKTALVPQFNSGINAASFVRSFAQRLDSGLISMVAATQQSICENAVHQNQRQSRDLDNRLKVKTRAMLAVPFSYLGEMRGVVSCVQFEPPAGSTTLPPGFTAEHLLQLQHTVGLLSRLIEYRLLAQCIGLEALG